MKKRMISMLLAAMMAVSFSAVSVSAEDKNTINIQAGTQNGITMSSNTFDQIYCSGNSRAVPASVSSIENVQMNIDSIEIQNAALSMTVSLNTDTDNIPLSISGDLYNGFYQDSIVGDMTISTDNFRVVLLGMYSENSDDTLLVNPDLTEQDHLKLYLADQENNLYLFEQALPSQLESLSVSKTNQENVKDVSWFVDFATPIECGEVPTDLNMMAEIKADQINSPYAASLQWVANSSYYQTFSLASDVFKYWSVPYGTYHLPTSISDNSTVATTTFYINEHMTINGTTYSDRENIIHYRNVRMDMGYPTGAAFRNMAVDGSVQQGTSLKSFGSSIKGMVGRLLASQIPYYNSITQFCDAIKNLTQLSSVTHKFGSDIFSLVGGGAASITYELPSTYELYNDDTKEDAHYLVQEGNVQSETNTTQNDTAVASFEWDVYDNGDSFIASGSKEVFVNYTVIP